MFLAVNGVRIFFDVVGSVLQPSGSKVIERQVLLLLHGGPGMDHMVFRPALDNLSSRFQLIYLDHRACGRSEAGPQDKWNLAQWGEDIAAFIQQLGIVKPIVLGTSFGGMVAQRLAIEHENLLGGLVLMSTSSRSPGETLLDTMEARGGIARRRAAEAFFSDFTDQHAAEEFMTLCFPFYASKGLSQDVLNRVTHRTDVSDHFLSRGGEFHQFDFRRHLAELRLPTLVVHGVDDPVISTAIADETFQALGSTKKRLLEIPRCSHFVEQDAPDVLASAIVDFFEPEDV